MATTPFMLQSLAFHEFLWKYISFKLYSRWNPQKEQFETDLKLTQNIKWYFGGLFSQFILFGICVFLLWIGLYNLENNKLINWLNVGLGTFSALYSILWHLYAIRDHNGKGLALYFNQTYAYYSQTDIPKKPKSNETRRRGFLFKVFKGKQLFLLRKTFIEIAKFCL